MFLADRPDGEQGRAPWGGPVTDALCTVVRRLARPAGGRVPMAGDRAEARIDTMSALSRPTSELVLLAPDWQADVTQLLDENHMVAWSDLPQRRTQFAVSLGQFLGSQRDTEVCVFYGRYITDLESFCYQLERSIPGPSLSRRIDGPSGVVQLLRSRASFRGRPETKYRYYLWHDADVLLKANHKLFGQLADALAGVAAEAE